jgi:cell division protein FtsB
MNRMQRVKQALAFLLGRAGGGRAPLSPALGRSLLALAAAGALVWFVLRDHGLLDHARLRRTLDSLDARSRHLETQIVWYRERNRLLQAGDPFTLEEEARRLGMGRPGEELFRVVLPEDTATAKE